MALNGVHVHVLSQTDKKCIRSNKYRLHFSPF